MTEWFYHLRVVWMAVVVLLATAAVTAVIHRLVMALSVGERARAFKAMSPTMLTPLAVLFGLIVGFLAAQVWSDGDRASAAVTREARALRTIVALSHVFPPPVATRIREIVREHIDHAVNAEWPAMAREEASLATVTALEAEALAAVLSLATETPAQQTAQRELMTALAQAFDARRDRIVISESSINGVKWVVVLGLAALLLVMIAIIHADNRTAAAIGMSTFAIGVAACVVLLAAHSRPFTGEISVSHKLLVEVLQKT